MAYIFKDMRGILRRVRPLKFCELIGTSTWDTRTVQSLALRAEKRATILVFGIRNGVANSSQPWAAYRNEEIINLPSAYYKPCSHRKISECRRVAKHHGPFSLHLKCMPFLAPKTQDINTTPQNRFVNLYAVSCSPLSPLIPFMRPLSQEHSLLFSLPWAAKTDFIFSLGVSGHPSLMIWKILRKHSCSKLCLKPLISLNFSIF